MVSYVTGSQQQKSVYSASSNSLYSSGNNSAYSTKKAYSSCCGRGCVGCPNK